MNATERQKIQGRNEKKFGTKAKKTKWEIICIETKNHPNEPKSLITGFLDCIYPTGDISFLEVLRFQLWKPDKNTVVDVNIPDEYKKSKKIVFRREIIASVMYIEEKETSQECQ